MSNWEDPGHSGLGHGAAARLWQPSLAICLMSLLPSQLPPQEPWLVRGGLQRSSGLYPMAPLQ